MEKVWVLVDLLKGKGAIGTKWVFRNKKDERGIVVGNKARLVAQGHTQEESIDYEEVFAPVTRIESIRLFLAYASFMRFMVYQMDVKSAFLYETIEEEVYVYQPPGFEDPDYPDKNQNRIFISQDKYVAEILRKFGLTNGKLASTPIDTEKPLLKDHDGEDVDVHTYRSMISSLMYLTSLRPDIMFKVCACSRFQVTPKISHLHAVKRIFRYLKGKPHLGLWYPKDSPFNLVAYPDSDYAGVSLDMKSTTGGCQFLKCRLISWKCKKQTVVATSSTKADLVRNVDSSTKFYMYLRFLQLMIRTQVSDLSSHTTKNSSPPLTQKVFANMRRVETHLFKGMIVAQQADDVADEGAAGVDVDPVPATVAEPSIPSPTPTTQPPPPSQELPSTSQVIPTPPPSPIAQPPSPQQQPQPSHNAKVSMDLLHTLLET
nr:copia protein [Tanacetum cinerariifolium]